MTAYSGGKQKIGKRIAEKIHNETLKIIETDNFILKGYVEPFCGMCGVYQHIPNLFNEFNIKYKASDINKNVILMWKELQNGWLPPENITEREYDRLKHNGETSAIKGYIGHQYSFGGKYFKGYAEKYGKVFNSRKLISNLSDIASKLKNVSFTNGDYEKFSKLKNYVIYCDPPYIGTECHYQEKFDHKLFYEWCVFMSKNNIVFLSEYNAPKYFRNILSISNKLTGISPSIKKSKRKKRNKVRTEKLYVL